MIFDYETLKFIWWVLIGVLLIGLLITNGMDMAVSALLFYAGRTEDQRRVMINTVAPHWDGNQVWLITAGGAIFAAWPVVYASAFSGFYWAMLLVLFSLFLRPLAFDYRGKSVDAAGRRRWDIALTVGSFAPMLIYGVAFGNLLQGVPFYLDADMHSHYEGSLLTALLPLLNPFAILTGLVGVLMMLAHAGLWLQLRTEDIIAERGKIATTICGALAIVLFVLAGVWVAYGIDGYRLIAAAPADSYHAILDKTVVRAPGAWMDVYSRIPLTMAIPALGIVGFVVAIILSRANRPGWGFVFSSLGMAGIILTAATSMFPFVMPSSIVPNSSLTMWDATSSHLTLSVMLLGVIVFVPIILVYTLWCYTRMWKKLSINDVKGSHIAY